MPSRALTFMQEIRDAIHNAERLLLIVGPKALSSDYVRAEWQHALADNKVVIPVLRLGGYDEFPAELQQVHGPSCLKERALEESLAEIARVLRDPIPPLGMIAGNLPDLPPHFQPRTAEMSKLAEEVFRGIADPAVVTGRLRAVLLHGSRRSEVWRIGTAPGNVWHRDSSNRSHTTECRDYAMHARSLTPAGFAQRGR
jgi:hypothetical protein